MQHDTNTDGPSFEQFILSLMGPVRALAHKYSRDSYRVECDDLYSIGITKVCEVAARAHEVATNPFAYAVRAAENAIIDEYNRMYRFSALSLDAPLSSDSDGSFTLGDTLEAPSMSLSSGPSKRTSAVNGALRRLRSTRQRAVLRRSFALVGYGATARKDTAVALGASVNAVDGFKRAGLNQLRKDAHLCKVVGVQA